MISVVCAIIEDSAGKVLACKRPQGKHLAGRWEFPGGKVEAHETPESALKREIAEELGVEICCDAPLSPVEWHDTDTPIRLIPFRCRIVRGQAQPLEHAEIRWCSLEACEGLAWADADLPILEELRLIRSLSTKAL